MSAFDSPASPPQNWEDEFMEMEILEISTSSSIDNFIQDYSRSPFRSPSRDSSPFPRQESPEYPFPRQDSPEYPEPRRRRIVTPYPESMGSTASIPGTSESNMGASFLESDSDLSDAFSEMDGFIVFDSASESPASFTSESDMDTNSSDSDSDDDNSPTIHHIENHCIDANGRYWLRVVWVDFYGPATWEPVENLLGATEMVTAYIVNHRG